MGNIIAFNPCSICKKEMCSICELKMLRSGSISSIKWNSVDERLPDEKGEYIVAFHPCWWDDVQEGKTVVGTDTFRGKTTWAKKKFQRVSHWMPLPEPPKGE